MVRCLECARSRVAGKVAACAVGLLLAFNMLGCATGAAATVNGRAISESEVTAYIESMRKQNNLQDDAQWAQYLVDSSQQASTLRDTVIDTFISREVLRQVAAERGVSVSRGEVDAALSAKRATYTSDESWQEALDQAGLTEEDYRGDVELSLLSDKLAAALAPDEEPDAQELWECVLKNYPRLGFSSAPESLGDLNEEQEERVRAWCMADAGTEAMYDEVAQKRSESDITINDMPQGLSYDVDTSSVEKSS